MPTQPPTQNQTPLPEPSYFDQRINAIGLLPEQRKIMVQWPASNAPVEQEIIYEDAEGNICFLVYDLDGYVCTYMGAGDPEDTHKSRQPKVQSLVVKRLKVPKVGKDGREQKYHVPKGAGTRPFFPPNIMSKFLRKEQIETLVLTEGYIKAACGFVNGFDVVGLTSISTYKDKEKQTLHPDILRVIEDCKVKNVVILYDGDARNLSGDALQKGSDLYTRPANFFSSARNIQELLKDTIAKQDCAVYYGEIMSDSVEGSPKGLDDLIIAFRQSFSKIKTDDASRKAAEAEAVDILLKDLNSFSRPGNYFFKLNITFNLSKLQQHLHISSANDFYIAHSERIKESEFIFLGTRWKWNSEKNELEVIIPGAAKNYARVGDSYYEKVPVPNKYGQIELQLHRRIKSTIMDDYGKNFVKHIPKYKAFCNVPDHINFQPVIHNCYNVYFPFEHTAEEGECPKILDFLKHIFGEQYEYGLDYIQLIFQQPTQMLPILCLVSKENETGKSTFAKLMKAIFTQNMVFVSNADFNSDFNAGWATRKIVCCEESFIEKKVTIEKIKSLSTGDKIMMNAKGKDQVEIDFFAVFLLLSNNEDNFIYAADTDVRYWVRKIPKAPKDNVNLLKEMIVEVPAFLHYLQSRQMHTKSTSRAWFNPRELETEALKKVIQASKPTVEKELRMRIKEMFLDFGLDHLMMTADAIKSEVFRGKYEANFISRILRENMRADNYYKLIYDGQSYDPWALPAGITEQMCEKKYVTTRSYYYRWEYQQASDRSGGETVKVQINENGRPFFFLRSHFVNPNEEALYSLTHMDGSSSNGLGEKNGDIRGISDRQRETFDAMTRKIDFGNAASKPSAADDLPF